VDWLEESETLHARVRAFAAEVAPPGETFEGLALELARFQARYSAGFARLVDAAQSSLDTVASIPAVPTAAFRMTRVAVHPPERDQVRFRTSGTTGAPGIHPMRTTATYRELALRWGRAALASTWSGRWVVVALAPPPTRPPTSSLGFMLAAFMQSFEGRPLVDEPASCTADLSERWLVSARGIDLTRLERSVELARERQEPLMVLATSFALVLLLDALGDRQLVFPKRTVVMQTGGYKGKSRELEPAVLRARTARAFGILPAQVVGEYGMTELTSQLYEGVLPGSLLRGDHGVYLPPRWLEVEPVDPVTLEPVPDGQVGVARFIDLGNVDSAVSIVTQDLVRRQSGGIELLGRRPGAESRGCSLALEALVTRGVLLGMARPSTSHGGSAMTTLAEEGGADAPVEPEWNSRPGLSPGPPARPGGWPRSPGVVTGSDGPIDRQDPRRRIDRLLLGARRLANPADPLGRKARERLPTSAGLSQAGVEWGLTRCLETHPSEPELATLCQAVPPAPRAHVLLSANVFVAAHRAIALALASSPLVSVRASRRELLMAALLADASPGLFDLVDELSPTSGDHVWAYGTDPTLEALRSTLPRGTVLHPHGAGLGIAVVDPSRNLARAASALACDTVLFDQKGCLSPRVALLLTNHYPTARRFAATLAEDLDAMETEVPRGSITPAELADQVTFRGAMCYSSELWPAGKGWVSLDLDGHATVVPPPSRSIHLVTGTGLTRLEPTLDPWIVGVGVFADESVWRAVHSRFSNARVSKLGKMQCPRFDGPVDRRPDPRGELL
jgi:hypothetical protein